MTRPLMDAVRQQLRSRHIRMALCLLFLPCGYSLNKERCRTCGEMFEHHEDCPDAWNQTCERCGERLAAPNEPPRPERGDYVASEDQGVRRPVTRRWLRPAIHPEECPTVPAPRTEGQT